MSWGDRRHPHLSYDRITPAFTCPVHQDNLLAHIQKNFKFKLSNQNSDFKIPYSGTPAKNAITIKRFLSSIYTVDDLNIAVNHYKK